MGKQSTMAIVAALASAMLLFGCGPKCPEIKSAMSQSKRKEDDEKRINTLVARRKALMAQAEKGTHGALAIEAYQFSVTAYEMAIRMQLQAIALASSSAGASPSQDALFNDTRCLLDKILNTKKAEKGDYLLGDREGSKLQRQQELIRQQFGRSGEPSEPELEYAYDNGLQPEPPRPKEAPEPIVEPAPAPAPDSAAAEPKAEPASETASPPAKKQPAKKPAKKPAQKQPKTEKP